MKAGYILIPNRAADTKFAEAEWSAEVLRTADVRVCEIAALVHDKKLENNGEVTLWDRNTLKEWILAQN